MKRILMVVSALACLTSSSQGWFFSTKKPKVIVRKTPPMDIGYEKSEALSLLNEIRESMGMNRLDPNEQLAAAAQAHARYLVNNDTSTHGEIEGLEGFTGSRPSLRANRAGYLSTQVSENLSTKNLSGKASIEGLFSAIYHRFGFLDASIDEVGVGAAQNSSESQKSAFVYLMGNSRLNHLCTVSSFQGYGRYVFGVCKDHAHRISKKHFDEARQENKRYNPKIILYPYDGQEDVPPVFYEEEPDPLPEYDVSGFPVSVTFNDYYVDRVRLISFRLFGKGSEPVSPVRLMSAHNDPQQRFTPYQFALFPLKRLAYDTEYRAQIVYEADGKQKEIAWHFHTRKPLDPLLRISQKEGTITIKHGRSYQLYLVPLDGHDVLTNVTFPDSVDVRFVDNNTLRITLMEDTPDSFDIKSEKRVIHVLVE